MVLFAPVVALGCGGDVQPITNITLSTGALSPAFSPDVFEYTATSLTSLVPVAVTVSSEDGADVTVNGTAAASGSSTTNVKLQPLEDITIVADYIPYVIHYGSDLLPAVTVSTATDKAGDEPILLTPNNAMLEIIDRAGRPVYYRNDGDVYMNFQQQTTPDLGTVYTYLSAGSNDVQQFVSIEGTTHVLDANFNEIESLELVANDDHDAATDDGHDFLLLARDHYVALSYAEQRVDLATLNPSWGSVLVAENIVQEVSAGSALLEWHNTDDPILYTESSDGNKFGSALGPVASPADYTHTNSLAVDADDDNLIVSMRHEDAIIELDRTTGQKLWTLGGIGDQFGLTAAQKFSHQHYVKKQADGTLLFFDNGNNKHQTQILEIGLDEQTKTLASYRVVYVKPAKSAPTLFEGSVVQPSPGRYVIGWGGGVFSSGDLAVTELVDGEIAWAMSFDNPAVQSYRALPMMTAP
jgi:hypothetical protein